MILTTILAIISLIVLFYRERKVSSYKVGFFKMNPADCFEYAPRQIREIDAVKGFFCASNVIFLAISLFSMIVVMVILSGLF